MPRLQFRREQTKRSDHRKIDLVFHAHESRFRDCVQPGSRDLIPRINFFDLRILVYNLRLVITHLIDLVPDLLEIRLVDHDSNQFLAAELDSLIGITDPGYSKRVARSPLIRKRIERKIDVLNFSSFRYP